MNLKQCMEKSGVTQYRMAKESGVSQSIICKVINGKAIYIRQKTRDKIKSYFPDWDERTLFE